ncbi:hypothetical protein [Planktotalea frisia]|jgi:hypothetical protein|uniref:hypothetical protein n=1 Tax=Planktotalea frisia TaxID=696762 RepID=UPI0023565DB6|nr:hypothetical protein [Planktotalea frisia]
MIETVALEEMALFGSIFIVLLFVLRGLLKRRAAARLVGSVKTRIEPGYISNGEPVLADAQFFEAIAEVDLQIEPTELVKDEPVEEEHFEDEPVKNSTALSEMLADVGAGMSIAKAASVHGLSQDEVRVAMMCHESTSS